MCNIPSDSLEMLFVAIALFLVMLSKIFSLLDTSEQNATPNYTTVSSINIFSPLKLNIAKLIDPEH